MCQPLWAKDAHTPVKTLSLGMLIWVFLDDINIWIARLDKENCPFQSVERLNRTKRQRKGEFTLSIEPGHTTFALGHQHSQFLGLWTQTKTYNICSFSFQAFRLGLNDTIGFLGSPACREQVIGLHGLHNWLCNNVKTIGR